MQTGLGKREMDRVRRTIAAIIGTESGLLRQRLGDSQVSTRRALWTFAIGSLVNLGLLGLVFRMIGRDAALRSSGSRRS